MPRQADFAIRQGSLLPYLTVSPSDASGALVPWLAGTTATFRMDQWDGFTTLGPSVIADRDVTAQDDGAGHLRLTVMWQAGDTATAGLYVASWKVAIGGTNPQEWPAGLDATPEGFFLIRILPTLVP